VKEEYEGMRFTKEEDSTGINFGGFSWTVQGSLTSVAEKV
jgi:hypothetical protein